MAVVKHYFCAIYVIYFTGLLAIAQGIPTTEDTHNKEASISNLNAAYIGFDVNDDFGLELDANITVQFDPIEVEEMLEDEERNVFFNFTPCCSRPGLALTIIVDDDKVAEITQNSTINITSDMLTDDVGYGTFTVRGKRLGLAELSFYLHSASDGDVDIDDDDVELAYDGYKVVVLRERGLQDDIYRYGIITFASLIYFGFGCQINLQTIWNICKKPVAPAIGVFCQFVVMPLLGFGVAKLLRLDDVYAFGLLVMSTSPGGGGSNTWAYLLGGDLDLSITMTFFSTLFSLLFMPFWMWALGRYFIDASRVSIPYVSLVRTLLTLVIPLLVGVLIRKYWEKGATFLIKITKPLTLFFIVYLLTYGTWVNWYMYEIMVTVPQIIPAAILLPLSGFLLGYLIARFVARLETMRAATVGIETGYQNPSIPIVMLQGNFQQPEGDLGAVMPVATAFFTPVPLYVWYLYIEIKRKCCKNGEVDAVESVDADKGAEEEKMEGEEMEGKAKADAENGDIEGNMSDRGDPDGTDGIDGKENATYIDEEKIQNGGLSSNGHVVTHTPTVETLTTDL